MDEEISNGNLIVDGHKDVTGFDILKKGDTIGAFNRVYETRDGGFILGMRGYAMLIAADSSLKVISGSGHTLYRDKDTGVITATVGARSYVTHPPRDIIDLLVMRRDEKPKNRDVDMLTHVFDEKEDGIYVKRERDIS